MLAGAWGAIAQTNPWEVPKPGTYQGSVELQRRQQQGSASSPHPATPSAPAGSGGHDSGALAAEYASWDRAPALPPERNPLLGRWTWQRGDMMSSLGCGMLFGDGVVEFRPNAVVGIKDGRESPAGTFVYRGGGKAVVALQKGGGGALLRFDFAAPDRISLVGAPCVMTRAGAAGSARAAAAPASASPAFRYKTEYRCGTEVIYVEYCRRDSDRAGYPPTADAENYCHVYYLDRPKTRTGGDAFGTELQRDLAAKLRSCQVGAAGAAR